MPGRMVWVRIVMAMPAPMQKKTSDVARYCRPMCLWSVPMSQAARPCGSVRA